MRNGNELFLYLFRIEKCSSFPWKSMPQRRQRAKIHVFQPTKTFFYDLNRVNIIILQRFYHRWMRTEADYWMTSQVYPGILRDFSLISTICRLSAIKHQMSLKQRKQPNYINNMDFLHRISKNIISTTWDRHIEFKHDRWIRFTQTYTFFPINL